jgi:phosphopantothenoylcysteine decarboxylase/phosphopantothenate--cysteine ligase
LRELRASHYDVAIATAAPADYAPQTIEKKISTDEHRKLVLELHATPKILDDIKKVSPRTFLVAFKAQAGLSHEELVSDAYQRLKRASADLIAVNDVGRIDIGFGSDFNEVILINPEGETKILERNTKRAIARKLLDVVSEQLELKRAG